MLQIVEVKPLPKVNVFNLKQKIPIVAAPVFRKKVEDEFNRSPYYITPPKNKQNLIWPSNPTFDNPIYEIWNRDDGIYFNFATCDDRNTDLKT